MNDEIKEILDKLKDGNWYNELDLTGTMWIELRWEETHLLLDYITNLQQENKTLHENNQNMQEEMARVWKENERLKEQINQYENPDDMALFYMWLDAKAKDKMKELEQENERLKELNAELKAITKRPTPIDYAMIQKRYEDYKSRCEKASDNLKRNYWINEHEHNDDVVNMTLNILQNGSDSNDPN
jgi:chromosome segregation ATPase